MTKSCVIGNACVSLVSKCVVKLLISAKNKFPIYFRSEDDVKAQVRRDVLVPALGAALAGIFLRAGPATRSRAERILEAEHLESDALRARVMSLVQDVLGDGSGGGVGVKRRKRL